MGPNRSKGPHRGGTRGPKAMADDVMRSAQLAAALEVSGWPKPGNVHRTADFEDTTFEQFIAGSIALGPQIRRAALRGIEAGKGRIGLEEVGVGGIIGEILEDVGAWHRGGNTHLGTCMLIVPLAASAGYTFASTSKLGIADVRGNAAAVMKATTVQDALDVQRAMGLLMPTGLGKLEDKGLPDLSGEGARRTIVEKAYTLYDMMKASSDWDNIAREWVTRMEISFCCGLPTWLRIKRETGNVNVATVNTFLTILSRYPDTFIARKIGSRTEVDIRKAVRTGLVEARKISSMASRALSMGGASNVEGIRALRDFDRQLRARGNEVNPGTTADLTSSSIMIAMLSGERP